jgi:DNA primase
MNPSELMILVNQVKEKTDIVEVIGSRIRMTRSLKAICPFHSDENPSFSVNVRGQFFYCFGCGVGGDVIKFLMLYERRGFVDVLLDLAARAGIQVPKSFGGR